jgi:hypothetical protein
MSEINEAMARLQRALARLETASARAARRPTEATPGDAAAAIAVKVDDALARLGRLLEQEA